MKKLLFLLLFSLPVLAQKADVLPRSTPEAMGVSSEKINQFLQAVAQSKHELHSFMMLRHGKVIAEKWWNPYRKDLKHTMYSVSKSFTATAVGFAVEEGLLTVDDKVTTFFPDEIPLPISPNLEALRIKDLLSMSVGQATDPTGAIVSQHDEWVMAFLHTPIVHKPGTQFLYNSTATYVLSAIVQRVTKQSLVDYLTPRLFEPLGITGIDWETDPKGINTGGWGLRLKTEDMAKFGQLFLQKGQWKGKQVLPKSWVEEASSLKIMQDPNAPQAKKDSSDWLQGYCYQMWRCRNNGFRADGANGQFIIVLPDKDVVIAITAETTDMQGEFNLIWRYLYPAIEEKALPENAQATAQLQESVKNLALTPLQKLTKSSIESQISGKTFVINANRLQSVKFDFNQNICTFSIQTDSLNYNIPCAKHTWELSKTQKPGPYLVERAKHNRVGLPPYQIASSYTWENDKTLYLTIRYIESPHTEEFRCVFEDNTVKINRFTIFERGILPPPFVGIMK